MKMLRKGVSGYVFVAQRFLRLKSVKNHLQQYIDIINLTMINELMDRQNELKVMSNLAY